MPDITGGYTFTSGQKNVSHTELNALGAGTINVSFHTGKSSVSANPSKTGTEVLVYDSAGAVYKKGTLSALFLDHEGLLSTRTAKTVPIAGDLVLLGDAAASFALKSITAANLVFGAASHTAPIANDIVPIYNSAGAAVGKITLGNLINSLAQHGSPIGADQIMVRENGGAVRRLSLVDLVDNLAAESVPAAAMKIPITDGIDVKNVSLAVLISGLASSLVTPAGTELMQVNDAGTLKKMLLSNLRTYCAYNPPYIKFAEVQAAGTDGGTFSSGAWRTRTINTEVIDSDSLVGAPASNQITLPAGTYRFRAEAPAYAVQSHMVKLYNITDAADVATGTTAHSAASTPSVTTSVVTGRFTIAGAKVFEVQHRCASSRSTDGFGVSTNFGASEVYTVVEFWKE